MFSVMEIEDKEVKVAMGVDRLVYLSLEVVVELSGRFRLVIRSI